MTYKVYNDLDASTSVEVRQGTHYTKAYREPLILTIVMLSPL